MAMMITFDDDAVQLDGRSMRAESPLGTLQLCRVTKCPPDLCKEIHRVCLEAPHYFLSTEGKLPDPKSIKAWFSEDELPLGCTTAHHFVFSISLNADIIGVVHVLAACRDPEQATVGLLLLSELHQGHGLGRVVFEMLVTRMREWGMKTCRIGVVANNMGGLAFWRAMGFEEIGEMAPMDGFLDKTIFMQKRL